ncbi:MAG: HTH-type transcriptional regulator CueR [Gammaproteobacteria bacterium]|nr:HTH-type transcriptional regulator CueR [Gammaproteobacteria bacterium]
MLQRARASPNEADSTDKERYSITQLAREFDITTRAIRFYEDRGLISPGRSGTTRIYTARDRVRLKLVLRGKRLGFSLKEIANILDMYAAERGETGQLQYMLDRLEEQRNHLVKQRDDIDLTLAELDVIESQCRQRLNAMVSSN